MFFHKVEYALFFPIIFLIYWLLFKNNLKKQNIFLLLSSLFFFGCFDWRFLVVLASSILIDYFIAFKIYYAVQYKKYWLWGSVVINLVVLGFFKYFNFFIENLTDFGTLFGYKMNLWTLKIILPIGISFYTFHGLSYVIDVYKNKIKPVASLTEYALFVSFFPLLVAGPIERATHLLPQIQSKRQFDSSKISDGLRQILWGLVKKIVIADNCAFYVNQVFDNPEAYSGSSLFVGIILFSFQIYGDFSGYSDIALGSARMLGFDLLQNFRFPYFSRDIAEFWRRWHISLSSWFRDYVYIPLGGSRGSKWQNARNVCIVFLISGFWHGANWTFIVYGFINFLYYLPLLLSNRNRKNIATVSFSNSFFDAFKISVQIVTTFILVSVARIFFRAESISEALTYFSKMVSKSFFSYPEIFPKTVLGYIFLFILIEWFGKNNLFAIEKTGFNWKKKYRLLFYYVLVVIVLYFYGKEYQFIYFQF